MLSVDWLSTPTAELRQPLPTPTTQLQLQDFPPATVQSNGSLQYTQSWVANSYGGYDAMAPDGVISVYNLVPYSMGKGVAAGPGATGSGSNQLPLMAISVGQAEEGSELTVFKDGAPLTTNDITSAQITAGRGVVFTSGLSTNYVFQAMQSKDKDTNLMYNTVARFNLDGSLANFTSGFGAGQNFLGTNVDSTYPHYIYSSNGGRAQQSTALAYDPHTDTNHPNGTLYVTDSLDDLVYAFDPVTGLPLATPNSVTLNALGSQTVTVGSSGLSSVGTGITVVAAINTRTLISSTANQATAGTAFSLTLTAYKSDGTVDTGYTGTVGFTSSDAQAVLPASYPFVSGDAGTKTFNITLKTIGKQTITIKDATNGLVNTTTPVVVSDNSSTVDHFVWAPTISSVAQGTKFNLTLTAVDAYGNPAPGYRGTVTLSSTPADGTVKLGSTALPTTYAFTAGDAGVHTFQNVSFNSNSNGAYTIKADDGSHNVTTPSISYVATTDATSTYALSGVPTGATANTSFSFTVTAQIPSGSTSTGYTGTVKFATTDNNALQAAQISTNGGTTWQTLSSASYTFTGSGNDNGVHTFYVKLYQAGSQTVTIYDQTDQPMTATTTAISVVGTTVNHLAISAPVSSVAANLPIGITVIAQDLYNNPAPSFVGSISFSGGGAGAVLPPSYTFVAGDAGTRSFAPASFPVANPYDVAVDSSGNVWFTNCDPVTGLSDSSVYKYTPSTGLFSTPMTGLATAGANSVAWDNANSRLVITLGGKVAPTAIDLSSHTTEQAYCNYFPIQFYNTSGTYLSGLGTSLYSTYNAKAGQMGATRLSNVQDIDVDAAGNIYVSTAEHAGAGADTVRVVDGSGNLLYVELGETHGASATPYTDANGTDEMYTLGGEFKMDYSAASGDDWTWVGTTSDPVGYPADSRGLGNIAIASGGNTPVVRTINGHKYMYLLSASNFISIFEQDANSYIFRPVSIISLSAGDVIGDGTGSFDHYLEPTDKMWVWTDGATWNAGTNTWSDNPSAANGDFNANEFGKATAPTWSAGFLGAVVGADGTIYFEVGKSDGTSQTGPAIIEMSIAGWTSTGSPEYNYNDASHLRHVLLPSNDNGLPGGYAAWGTQASGKSNDANGLAYDDANDVMYLVGGPPVASGSGGAGTVVRAYKNWSHLSFNGSYVSDLTGLTTNPDPSNPYLAWSIQPSWVNPNSPTRAIHVMTSAGGYVFLESRDAITYAYFGTGSLGGTMAGVLYPATRTTLSAFPDNLPPFQAITRQPGVTSGEVILATEGFYTEPFYRILAPGDHSPTASITQDVQASASVPLTVTFRATAADPDNDTLSYSWQFGDGTTDHTNSPVVTHTYTYSGGFKVDLTVSDNKGGYADAVSTVTVGPAATSISVGSMANDSQLNDSDTVPGGAGFGVADGIGIGGVTNYVGGNGSHSNNYAAVFPFDLWAAGLRPGDHVNSTTSLPALTFVLNSLTGTPSGADLYAVAMRNTLEIGANGGTNGGDFEAMYYAGTGDTSAGAVLLQQNFLTSASPVGTRIGINAAAAATLANYINAALDAGNRYIVLRISPQNTVASTSYYAVNANESGSVAPQLRLTPLPLAPVSNTGSYSIANNALAAGLSQYGDSADSSVTFSTFPGNSTKYLAATCIRTDNGDKATSIANGSTLQFAVNQSATVYVLYDDAITGSHRADYNGGWLSAFSDTGDNITNSAGHTFSVYKRDNMTGLVNLGANTYDGVNGTGQMYSVLVMPTALQASNLVGYWKLDEATGSSVTDSAPAGTTADIGSVIAGSLTANGVPVWNDGYLNSAQQFHSNPAGAADAASPTGIGRAGTALHFDGSDYVSISNSSDLLPSNFAISLWAAGDSWEKTPFGWQNDGYLIYKQNAFSIQVHGSDSQQIDFTVYDSGGVAHTVSYVPPANPSGNPDNFLFTYQWHQFGMTYNGSTVTAYFDGVAVGTTSCASLPSGNSYPLIVGGAASKFFQGSIDDVRLYNTANVSMEALANLGWGVSAVDGSPTAKGTANTLQVTGVSGMTTAGVSVAATTNATEGGTTGVFTVSRTGSTASALTVSYTVGGTATNGTDYSPLSGSVTIPAGQSSATINVAAIDDHFAELGETVDLALSSGNGYYLSSPATAQLTIANAAGDSVNYTASSNLVGYWRFDENSGNTVYDSIASANSSPITSTTWVSGVSGSALYLQVNNNYTITINDSGSLHPASMSTSLMAKSGPSNPTWNKTTYLISGNNNFYIGTTINTETLTFAIYAGGSYQTVSYTPTFDITQWHQYGLTYNDSTKLLTGYIDGVSVATKTITGTRPTVASTITLGKSGTNYLRGYIDEVSLYNAALSATDMATLVKQVGPAISLVGVGGTHAGAYSVAANALQPNTVNPNLKLYGDASNTFATIPGKYLGSTLIQTSSLDNSSQGLEQLGLSTSTNALVCVLYDDAITGSHRADYNGGWLSKFSDTGDNIIDSSGHTFSVYSAKVSAGTVWLGGNTADGSSGGLMYTALVQLLDSSLTSLNFSAVPLQSTAGNAFSLTVTARNPDGSVNTGYTGTVQFSSSDGQAGLPGNYTFAAGDNGVKTFSGITLKTAGYQAVTAADTGNSSINTTTTNILVTATTASKLGILTQPSGAATAGSVFATQPVVALQDTYGNVVTGDSTHTVTASRSTGTGTLQGTTTVTLVNGVATFSGLYYTVAETMTIGFTTTAGGFSSPASSNVVVSPAAASTLSVSAPGSANAGTAFSVTVTAKDLYGNTATGYLGTVRFTSTDGAASLPANYTFVSGDAGQKTFTNGVTLNTGGNQTVTATDTVTGTITGSSGTIAVTGAIVTIAATTPAASESGTNGVFTLTRNSTSGTLTVNYSIGGSAVNGTDDTSLAGSVTFANGSSTATITVTPTNDTLAELTETVDLTLTSGTGYTIGSPSAATVTIADNDSAGYLDSSNLVAYWRLDEAGSSTTAYDLAPSGSSADNGTATNADWSTSGKIGNAYHAASTGNHQISVTGTNADLNTNYITVSVWAKGDTGPNWASTAAILNKANQYQITPSATNNTKVKFGVYVGSSYLTVIANGASDVSAWHHYAMTYDGTTLRTYVDGVAGLTTSATGTVKTTSNALYLGGTSAASTFTGLIDEVRIYNTALNSTDIATLAGQTAPSVTAVQGVTVASNVQVGTRLYTGASGNTFSTFPGNSPKYLGSTLLQTDNASANSTGDKVVGFTVNQPAIVYVLYDDAISGTHRADSTGGWLASGNGFTDTGDNITDSSGHTFSVYKALLTAGSGNTIWLGGNTLDGTNGTGLMYDVLIQPLL